MAFIDSLNLVVLFGRVGGDAVILEAKPRRSTKTGDKPPLRVAAFDMVTDEIFLSRKRKSDWHKIRAYGKIADFCEKHVKKGIQTIVKGRLKYFHMKKDEVPVIVAYIQADEISFVNYGQYKKRKAEEGKASMIETSSLNPAITLPSSLNKGEQNGKRIDGAREENPIVPPKSTDDKDNRHTKSPKSK